LDTGFQGNVALREKLFADTLEDLMRRLLPAILLSLMSGLAFAQNSGPAPQAGMEKPGTTNGAKPDGSMETGGMSGTKGNVKRESDDAPAPAKPDKSKK
jgi:hypothetical protein